MRYLIMCRSLTYAQRSQRLLEKGGISAGVVKAPTGLSGSGCSYCVSVSGKNGARAIDLLSDEGMLRGKVYIQDADGSVREVVT